MSSSNSQTPPLVARGLVRGTNLVRWALFGVTLVATVVAVVIRIADEPLAPITMLLAFLVANLSQELTLRKLPGSRPAILTTIAIDIVVALLVIHLTGGVESPLIVLLPLVVLAPSLYLGLVGALAATAILVVAFAGLVILEHMGVMGHVDMYGLDLWARMSYVGVVILTVAVATTGIGGFAAALVHDRRLHTRKLLLLNRSTRRVLRHSDPDEIVRFAVTTLHKDLGYPSVTLFAVSEARRQFIARASIIKDKRRKDDTGFVIDIGEGIISRSYIHEENIYVPDTRKDPDYYEVRSQVRSLACFPLKNKSAVSHMLVIESDEVDAFADDDIQELMTFSRAISAALEAADFYKGLQEEVARRALLLEITNSISADLNVESIGALAVDTLRHWLGFEFVQISVLDQDELKTIARRGSTRGAGSREAGHLSIPLKKGEDVIGMLEVRDPTKREFDDVDQALLYSIGRQLSIAVANALHLEEIQEVHRGELRELTTGALFALASALEARDKFTRGHSERVATIASFIARRMGITGDDLDRLMTASKLHDIGMIGLSDSILLKKGALDPEELRIMRTHPRVGERICASLKLPRDILAIIRGHHERWDGSGYPDGLRGEQIPLFARILAVADVYEAMTAERPYRQAKSHEDTIEHISKGSGTEFDVVVVGAFLEAEGEIKRSQLKGR